MESIDSEGCSIEQLENKLSQVRNDIKNVEDNIKNATGVEYGRWTNHFRKRKAPSTSSKDNDFGSSLGRSTNFSKARANESADFEGKPKIASIITTVKHASVEPPADEDDGADEEDRNASLDVVDMNGSRDEAITYHKKPELSESEIKRGSRMFGLMMKTFNDFKKDSEKSNQEMKKRDEIMAKVTEQEKQADIIAKEERSKLLRLRHMKQRELVNLRKAIRYKELEQISKQEFDYQSKFIKTKTSPAVFYRPYTMNESTKNALSESTEELKRILDDKIAHFHLSISVIENNPHSKSTLNELDKSVDNDNDLIVDDTYVEDDMLGSDNDD